MFTVGAARCKWFSAPFQSKTLNHLVYRLRNLMKTHFPPFLALTLLATVPTFAHAATYRNYVGHSQDNLDSREGLSILISASDFQSGDLGDNQTDTAEQIQITVSGPHALDGSSIRVVLTPNCVSQQNNWPVAKSSLTADLVSGEAILDGILVTGTSAIGGEKVKCQPTVSVVVNGTWQTDPINGTHDFRLQSI